MSNEPTHVPGALYPCGDPYCPNHVAATDIRWRDTQWLCADCTGPGCTGISLADYLARRDTPVDYDGLPVEMVEAIESDSEVAK